MSDPFQKAKEEFGRIYGCQAGKVQKLFDAAAEAEEAFDLDDLERSAKEGERETKLRNSGGRIDR